MVARHFCDREIAKFIVPLGTIVVIENVVREVFPYSFRFLRRSKAADKCHRRQESEMTRRANRELQTGRSKLTTLSLNSFFMRFLISLDGRLQDGFRSDPQRTQRSTSRCIQG